MKNEQIKNAKEFALESIKNYPAYTNDIMELWYLMISEIEDGASVHNECNLFILSVNELILNTI